MAASVIAKKTRVAVVGAVADKGKKPFRFLRRDKPQKTPGNDLRKFRITLVDVAAILLAVGAIVFSSFGAVNAAGEARVIISNGVDEWVYPLDKERSIDIPGPLGITTIHIHDHAVCIEKSPCPNQTCVAAGDISEAGQWLACLPNQVFVRIEGGSDHDSVDSGSW